MSGSAASIASTLVVTVRSHAEARRASAGTNATSHWLWRGEAKRRQRPSLRHTAVGYAIHHLCSVFWASVYERWFAPREPGHATRAVAAGGAVAALAFAVDYAVVPRRLNPGFERHLSPRSMFLAYAAFGAGLAVAACVRRR